MHRFCRSLTIPHTGDTYFLPIDTPTGVDPSGDHGVRGLFQDQLEDIRPLASREIGDRVFVQREEGTRFWVAVVRGDPFIPGTPGQQVMSVISMLAEAGQLVEDQDYVGCGNGRIRLCVSSCGRKLEAAKGATGVNVSGPQELRLMLQSDHSISDYITAGDVRFRTHDGKSFVRGIEIDQVKLAPTIPGYVPLSVTKQRTRGGARPGAGRPKKCAPVDEVHAA